MTGRYEDEYECEKSGLLISLLPTPAYLYLLASRNCIINEFIAKKKNYQDMGWKNKQARDSKMRENHIKE